MYGLEEPKSETRYGFGGFLGSKENVENGMEAKNLEWSLA